MDLDQQQAAHKPAVPGDIRGQNSGQPPLYVIAAQDALPKIGEIELLYGRIVGRCSAMPMSETGQTEKTSVRANVFRVTSDNGH